MDDDDENMAARLVGLSLLMFLLLLLFILACRPWRFFSSSLSSSRCSSSITAAQNDDIERPLFSEPLACTEEPSIQTDRTISSPTTFPRSSSNKIQTDCYINQGDSLILDVISDTADSSQVSHTLKRGSILSRPVEDTKHAKKDFPVCDLPSFAGKGRAQFSAVKAPAKGVKLSRSNLNLKVITGPSYGLCCSRLSTNTSMLPVTIGRVPPSDVVLKDSEVSGKHAQINWNMNKSKWEMMDMGSLNGTFLNSQAIHRQSSRQCSEPVDLRNGDVITLGTLSKLSVHISQHAEHRLPSGVGVASDPMAIRRGAKSLPMEDVCYYQCPLPGPQQFGIFGIFDGHGGEAAAKTASRMLPQNIVDFLSITEKRDRVVSQCDASDVLREAFSLTEAAMNHLYEGCTATVLLVWIDHNEEVFAQCANVGDSACVMSVSGQQITMTEDHRVIGVNERTRFMKMGMPVKDGESRLCGLNLGRMLGDKFLKEQDCRFSAEPYVSEAVHVSKAEAAFALLASDGLWDVISIKKAVQLILQMKDRYSNYSAEEISADKVANYVLDEARSLRTKDNTSVVFLDFDSLRTSLCNIHS